MRVAIFLVAIAAFIAASNANDGEGSEKLVDEPMPAGKFPDPRAPPPTTIDGVPPPPPDATGFDVEPARPFRPMPPPPVTAFEGHGVHGAQRVPPPPPPMMDDEGEPGRPHHRDDDDYGAVGDPEDRWEAPPAPAREGDDDGRGHHVHHRGRHGDHWRMEFGKRGEFRRARGRTGHAEEGDEDDYGHHDGRRGGHHHLLALGVAFGAGICVACIAMHVRRRRLERRHRRRMLRDGIVVSEDGVPVGIPFRSPHAPPPPPYVAVPGSASPLGGGPVQMV